MFFEVEKIVYKDSTKIEDNVKPEGRELTEGVAIVYGLETKLGDVHSEQANSGAPPLVIDDTSRKSFFESPILEEGPNISKG